MKTKILMILLCLLSFGAIGQDGSFASEKTENLIDPKTGDTTRSTKWYNLDKTSTYLLNFRFVKLNSAFFLEMKYNFGEGQNFIVPKGDSVWIKLVNGASMTLFAKDSVKTRKGGAAYPGSMKGLVTPGAHVKYQLTQSDMAALATSPVDKIRIFTSRGFDNITFPKDQKNAMQVWSMMLIVPAKSYEVRAEVEVPEEQKAEEW